MKTTVREALAKAAVWSAQIWLTMFFVGAGYAKLAVSPDHLNLLLGWTVNAPLGLVRGLGAVEMLLGLAMSFNLLSAVALPRLPAFCGAVLAAMSVVMAVLHLVRLDFGLAILNVFLVLLGVTVTRGYVGVIRQRRLLALGHMTDLPGRNLRKGAVS